MDKLALSIRLVLGGVFVWAGTAKLVQTSSFVEAVAAFDMLPAGWVVPFALSVIWVELITGGLLLLDIWPRSNALVVLGLLVVFSAALGINMYRGNDVTCGCFGGGGETSLAWSLLRDVVLAGVRPCYWRERSEKIKMKRKVLAVELNPPIKGFTVFSLSILATNELYLPWFYSQHIQLYFAKTQIQKGVPKIDFYRPSNNRLLPSPLLETRWLDRDLISIVNEDIVQFVVKYIDRDYYIQLYLNEFYIPDRLNYNTQKNIHETLIHGYDLYDEAFDVIGYNKIGQYVSSKLKFADFKKAYTKIDYSDFKEAYMKIKYSPNHMAKVGLLRYDNNRHYEFDLNLVLEQIRDYIESNNTSEKFRMLDTPEDGIYGTETYCYLPSMRSSRGRSLPNPPA